jgi:hypothetical protein
MEQFKEKIIRSYTFKGRSVQIGAAFYGENPVAGCHVSLPLSTLNRHGLISGATGTGKTKTLQLIAEQLSQAGTPVLLMDVKGDLSGLAMPGVSNPKIEQRAGQTGLPWQPCEFPVEFLTLSDEPGVRLKATVSEFGPVLLSKILELNDNQSGLISLIFKYCDDKNLPLLDLKDLQSVIKYIQQDGNQEFLQHYGYFQSSSAGIIMRKLIELEQQDADDFFGEPSFDVFDLTRKDRSGKGYINILRLTDMQGKPALFSTFMLCLLAEVFAKFPEKGDPEQPDLVIFLDEAHLIFKEASKSLLDQLEMTIKLIRSKGVGIIFVTQTPTDIPDSILGQLGLKVQHALRAFTAKDRQAIKAVSENYPYSDFYKTDELITQLGIGEALVTALDEKGRPTELVHTLLCPPASRMDVLTAQELGAMLGKSDLVNEYNQVIDRKSAYEILNSRLSQSAQEAETDERRDEKAGRSGRQNQETVFEEVLKSPVTRTVMREVTRGLLGVLGLTGSSRRRR